MLIKVLYGENRTLHCNADCRVDHLMEYIRTSVGLVSSCLVDLSDCKGNVQGLQAHKTDVAKDILGAEVKEYIVIKKENETKEDSKNSSRKRKDIKGKENKKNANVIDYSAFEAFISEEPSNFKLDWSLAESVKVEEAQNSAKNKRKEMSRSSSRQSVKSK